MVDFINTRVIFLKWIICAHCMCIDQLYVLSFFTKYCFCKIIDLFCASIVYLYVHHVSLELLFHLYFYLWFACYHMILILLVHKLISVHNSQQTVFILLSSGANCALFWDFFSWSSWEFKLLLQFAILSGMKYVCSKFFEIIWTAKINKWESNTKIIPETQTWCKTLVTVLWWVLQWSMQTTDLKCE